MPSALSLTSTAASQRYAGHDCIRMLDARNTPRKDAVSGKRGAGGNTQVDHGGRFHVTGQDDTRLIYSKVLFLIQRKHILDLRIWDLICLGQYNIDKQRIFLQILCFNTQSNG